MVPGSEVAAADETALPSSVLATSTAMADEVTFDDNEMAVTPGSIDRAF
jgi:hypothetical protein